MKYTRLYIFIFFCCAFHLNAQTNVSKDTSSKDAPKTTIYAQQGIIEIGNGTNYWTRSSVLLRSSVSIFILKNIHIGLEPNLTITKNLDIYLSGYIFSGYTLPLTKNLFLDTSIYFGRNLFEKQYRNSVYYASFKTKIDAIFKIILTNASINIGPYFEYRKIDSVFYVAHQQFNLGLNVGFSVFF